jgi:hypothetical protein
MLVCYVALLASWINVKSCRDNDGCESAARSAGTLIICRFLPAKWVGKSPKQGAAAGLVTKKQLSL